MGRAMLIICAGVLLGLGYIGFGTSQQSRQIAVSNAGYADDVIAKNAARTAIHQAMNELHKDESWKDDKTESNPWIQEIENAEVHLYFETVYQETDPDRQYESDTLRVVSTAHYQDPVTDEQKSRTVINVYGTSAIDEFVQSFRGATALATENIDVDIPGPAAVSGSDASGNCGERPAFVLTSEAIKSDLESDLENMEAEGDIEVDSLLDYRPTRELIERLRDHEGVTFLEGTYEGDMGTASDPDVFFVESPSQISSDLDDGYGILIFSEDGEIAMEDSTGEKIPVAENFTFNGLNIFDNADELSGENIPSVNGSILFMNDDGPFDDTALTLNENLLWQYDCEAEKYVKMAAAKFVPYSRYRLIASYE
ncbi:MAG: hypothetical protein ACOC4S_00300 [Balneolaceae bacterium]